MLEVHEVEKAANAVLSTTISWVLGHFYSPPAMWDTYLALTKGRYS